MFAMRFAGVPTALSSSCVRVPRQKSLSIAMSREKPVRDQ
jgi:hypothetical protein